MNTRRGKWLGAIGAVLLTGGLVTSIAVADDDRHKNPFTRILHKLDQILDKLGSGGDGNHTLRWDTNHSPASRFVTLAAFHNQAVLDKNTGLVWEQAPIATTMNWFDARHDCPNRTVGGAVGWRLPSVIELKSVQDPSLPPPFVPTTVFTGVQSTGNFREPFYWTATTSAQNGPTQAWFVDFQSGFAGNPFDKTEPLHVWCVRGLMQESVY